LQSLFHGLVLRWDFRRQDEKLFLNRRFLLFLLLLFSPSGEAGSGEGDGGLSSSSTFFFFFAFFFGAGMDSIMASIVFIAEQTFSANF